MQSPDVQSRLAQVAPLWSRDHWKNRLRPLFGPEEIERLDALCRLDDAPGVVYAVYENPFARSGGVYAVADFYSRALAASGHPVLVVSPLQRRLTTAPELGELEVVEPCTVSWGGRELSCAIQLHEQYGVLWALFDAPGFFETDGGATHSDPYAHAEPRPLVQDSLFACAAIPRVLEKLIALGRFSASSAVLHAQDWELASLALTVKQAQLAGALGKAIVALTLHNAYDQHLPEELLGKLTSRSFASGTNRPTTVLEHMLPLVDVPVTTVSHGFAAEFSADPLQSEVFAHHLQLPLWKLGGVVGVPNGLFGTPGCAFSELALQAAEHGDVRPILAEKREKGRVLRRVLQELGDARVHGHIDFAGLSDDTPVFFAFGRLDPNQKGFDVLSRALERVDARAARFILVPHVTDTNQPFFRDLVECAEQRAGQVVLYPFRMMPGYREAMAGSTFAVMPSIYEPFGAATEPYLQGTPVVARATGGLVDQVVDYATDPASATGLLYREPRAPSAAADFRSIVGASAEERLKVPSYRGMVDALTGTLQDAIDLYRNERASYARMLARLHRRAGEFSWERTIQQYFAVYGLASRDDAE